MSKSETKAWGPILDALPFGQKLFDKRWERLNPIWNQVGLFLIRVAPSGSMSPLMIGGELLLFEPRRRDIRVSDVVYFFFDEGKDKDSIIHRVIQIEEVDGEKRYYTKGDSNLKQDRGYRTQEQIKAHLIHIFRPPLLGRYLCSDYFWRKGKFWVGKPSIQVD